LAISPEGSVIIDCDSHLMPRDAFDGIDGEFASCKPILKFNQEDLYVDVDFPGYPADVPGTSPLLAPGSGAMFKSLWDSRSRMDDYDRRLGIEQHVVLPQFSGWWSYLIEPQLACRMARSHNQAPVPCTRTVGPKTTRTNAAASERSVGEIRRPDQVWLWRCEDRADEPTESWQHKITN